MRDMVGISWRPVLAAGIFSHLDDIDVVEVIADDRHYPSRRDLQALRTLAAQVPIVLHGISLGLVSMELVAQRRLDCMARLVDTVQPLFWSEHLAFVRGGGYEIGHLAAPPRTDAFIDGLDRNLTLAQKTVGAKPVLENIATLVVPPGSEWPEAEWLTRALSSTNTSLLLDLHNLYANALNFGPSWPHMLQQIPANRIQAIHLAGGRWLRRDDGRARLLDDHQHDPPDEVYDMLEEVGRLAPDPVTVILERDGQFPAMEALMGQIRRAREALCRGRQAMAESGEQIRRRSVVTSQKGFCCMNTDLARARQFQEALARAYSGEPSRAEFFMSNDKHLSNEAAIDSSILQEVDTDDFHLAIQSFSRKRRTKLS